MTITSPILDHILNHRLHPTSGRLLARIDKVQQHGLIILPTNAQYETSTATILEVGPELPDYLQPGIRILPHETSGLAVYDDDTCRYVMYKLEDIQAAFVEGDTPEAQAFVQEYANA